jgi:hypothetical protein
MVQDVLTDDEELADPSELGTVDEPEDIDPSDWLSGGGAAVADGVGYFTLRNGKRLKIAMVTDGEENRIRTMSKRPAPGSPGRGLKVDFSTYRREFIAFSINKAHGYLKGDPKQVTGEQLKAQPVGELTQMLKAVMELSGMGTIEDGGTDPESFFI